MTGDESLTESLTAALAAEADYRTAKAHADAVRGSRAYEAANAAYSDALDGRAAAHAALDVAASIAYAAAYAAKELP